ncbi:hypothetical protein K474DRAFT_674269 [Panus rudis PR-1116 ss-1]|nr:hypothetical protein K474DRAFT_674269 [Panus rudis PR-1116 ss-1]
MEHYNTQRGPCAQQFHSYYPHPQNAAYCLPAAGPSHPPATYHPVSPFPTYHPNAAHLSYQPTPYNQYAYSHCVAYPTDPQMQAYPQHELNYPEYEPEDSHVHIHAPIPISSYSTLIPPPTPSSSHSSPTTSCAEPTILPSPQPVTRDATPRPSPIESTRVESEPPFVYPLEKFMNAQVIIPTPCDILRRNKGINPGRGRKRARAEPEDVSPVSECPPPVQLPPPPPMSKGKLSVEKVSTPMPMLSPVDTSEISEMDDEKRPENQRKAYFRGVAQNVGFESTDPDTITSHDKKRYYLECLEYYVLWLHEQLRIVGQEPEPIDRIKESKGLDTRSIRTLLLHMQNESRQLNAQVLEEEQTFYSLQRELMSRGLPVDIYDGDTQFRRHSVASGDIPWSIPVASAALGTSQPTNPQEASQSQS